LQAGFRFFKARFAEYRRFRFVFDQSPHGAGHGDKHFVQQTGFASEDNADRDFFDDEIARKSGGCA
jgi:hypothetical protein